MFKVWVVRRAQVRAQAVKQVLLGYLRVPESPDAPLDVVLNPGGEERRAERRVWNNGDGRIKLVRASQSLWTSVVCHPGHVSDLSPHPSDKKS